MSSTSGPESPGAHTHETGDVNLRPVVISGIGLLLILMISAVAMFGLFDVLAVQEAHSSPPANALAAIEGRRLPPAPRLQAHPIKDLQELRAVEQERLTSYGWIDQQAGVVRIPIERAMQLLAERAGQPGTATR